MCHRPAIQIGKDLIVDPSKKTDVPGNSQSGGLGLSPLAPSVPVPSDQDEWKLQPHGGCQPSVGREREFNALVRIEI